MIPLDARLVPPEGYLLVRRLEQPMVRGLIIVPEHARSRSSDVATVVATSSPAYEVGEHVLLGASVGRTLLLGERGEVKLQRVHAGQVLARVSLGSRIVNEGMDLDQVGVPQYEIDERTRKVDEASW